MLVFCYIGDDKAFGHHHMKMEHAYLEKTCSLEIKRFFLEIVLYLENKNLD